MVDQIVQLEGIEFARVKLLKPCPHVLEQRPQLLVVVRGDDCASLTPPKALGCRTTAVATSTHVESDASARSMTPLCTVAATRVPSSAPATLTPGAPLADRNDT